MKQYFGINKLKKNISEFKKNYKNQPEDVSIEKLKDILFYEEKSIKISTTIDGNTFSDRSRFTNINMRINTLRAGSTLFRARKITENDMNNISYDSFFEPPVDIAKKGRANYEKQSLLYTGNVFDSVLDEARINDDDLFIISAFSVIEDIDFTEIGFKTNESTTSKGDKIRKSFIDKIFSTPDQHIYAISAIITNKIFNLEVDGWCYPSIISKHKCDIEPINYCMTTKSKRKIKLHHAFVCHMKENNIGFKYEYIFTNKIISKVLETNDATKSWIDLISSFSNANFNNAPPSPLPKYKTVLI